MHVSRIERFAEACLVRVNKKNQAVISCTYATGCVTIEPWIGRASDKRKGVWQLGKTGNEHGESRTKLRDSTLESTQIRLDR